MMRSATALLLIAATCACSQLPRRTDAHVATIRRLEPGDRLIVAAVDNHRAPFLASVGGTPRAYDGLSVYGPTPHSLRTMHAIAREYGLREVTAWPIQPLDLHCAVLEIAVGVDRNSLLARLADDPRVKLAQALQTFSARSSQPADPRPLYNDPYVGLQHGFAQMNVAGAHPWSTGAGITIAIVDTGADTRHPDLHGSIAATGNFVDDDANQFRRDRHGTEIAGVIGAIANNHEGIVGVAPRARLAIFKACWQIGADADAAACNSFTIARALVAAFAAHAKIVNLSLAGPDDRLLRDLIREGSRRGILFVGAAARNREDLMRQPEIIEVASAEAMVSRDEAAKSVLQAPGREILTLLPDARYDFASGDSIATAEVSGIVALLLAEEPGLSAAAARKLLIDTSRRTAGAAGVDACAAVAALGGHGGCADDFERRMASH
jgi:hypothetical protein